MKIGVYIKNRALSADPRLKTLLLILQESGCELYRLAAREDLKAGTDMVLSVGGDGTFLSASKRVGDSGVPILGVNLGRLGFLSENSPESVVEAILFKDYSVEDRTMLKAEIIVDGSSGNADGGSGAGIQVTDGSNSDFPGKGGSDAGGSEVGKSNSNVLSPYPEGFYPYALNEVTVHRSGAAILGISVSIDGQQLPRYWADGLIVATSSGSTAYSLSAGGPICMPESKVLIISPISPHNLNVRPLIVPSSSTIEISVKTRDEKAVMTMDNRTMDFDESWKLIVSVAQFSLKRIRLSRSNFVKALTSKLFWGEDIRNNGE